MKNVKTKKVTVKDLTRCTGYSIKYGPDGKPMGARFTSESGIVDIDAPTMNQVNYDWESHPDDDTTLPQRYVFDVEAE